MLYAFKPVFDLALLHEFYTNNKCGDFSIAPVSATRTLLKQYDGVFRNRDNMGHALIRGNQNNTTAARPFPAGTSLVFALRLQNPSFSNFTNEYPDARKTFLFTNDGIVPDPDQESAELNRSLISISGQILGHRIASNVDVALILKDSNNQEITRQNYPAGSAGEVHSFDLRALENGFYTVSESAPASTTRYYIDNELAFDNVFGLVQIINKAPTPFTYDGQNKFRISFTAKSSKWTYYVVAPGMQASDLKDNLKIVDNNNPQTLVFTKTYPLPGADPTAALLYKDVAKVALFQSNAPIPMRQSARGGLELRKNNTVLISHMPNPDVKNPTAQMFINI
jgi:hypothetical protein